jgi:hypothetical protein
MTVAYETNKLVNNLLINLNRFKNSERDLRKTIDEYFDNTDYFFNILDDCFGLVSQSIQAIRTLQYENLNLKEQLSKVDPADSKADLTLSHLDTHENKQQPKIEDQNKSYMSVGSKNKTILNNSFTNNNSRLSIRRRLKDKSERKEGQRSLSTSFDNPDSVKITNGIIKRNKITEKYNIFFAEKYANGSYPDFLEDLVHMKFPIEVLKEIKRDVDRFEENITNEQQVYNIFTNKDEIPPEEKYRNVINLKKKLSNDKLSNFEGNLRNYDQKHNNKKPFNKFATHNGFSNKEIFKAKSPIKIIKQVI